MIRMEKKYAGIKNAPEYIMMMGCFHRKLDKMYNDADYAWRIPAFFVF